MWLPPVWWFFIQHSARVLAPTAALPAASPMSISSWAGGFLAARLYEEPAAAAPREPRAHSVSSAETGKIRLTFGYAARIGRGRAEPQGVGWPTKWLPTRLVATEVSRVAPQTLPR
jgi:hypothetical protein